MQKFLLLLLIAIGACGTAAGRSPIEAGRSASDAGSSATVPPSIQPGPPAPRCARMVAGGYYDDRLETKCTFGVFDGFSVCIPDNMPRVISGVCDPKGGPDRIWIDKVGCSGDGSSRYALSTNTRQCGELRGPIEVVSLTPQPDQNVYLSDLHTKACTPSGLLAKPESPIVDRAPSPPAPFYLYSIDLAAAACGTQ